MNFNFDRMAMLAGVEAVEKKVLNEQAKADEEKIRQIIREELCAITEDTEEENAFNNARETRSLVQASHFINMSKYGRIHPAPGPVSTNTARQAGSSGFIGGLGFH